MRGALRSEASHSRHRPRRASCALSATLARARAAFAPSAMSVGAPSCGRLRVIVRRALSRAALARSPLSSALWQSQRERGSGWPGHEHDHEQRAEQTGGRAHGGRALPRPNDAHDVTWESCLIKQGPTDIFHGVPHTATQETATGPRYSTGDGAPASRNMHMPRNQLPDRALTPQTSMTPGRIKTSGEASENTRAWGRKKKAATAATQQRTAR